MICAVLFPCNIHGPANITMSNHRIWLPPSMVCPIPSSPPTCPANNKDLKETRSEQKCSWDTPFSTQSIRYPNPVPN